MTLSVFDLFTIGIGPSSSHTVGPMHAAGRFVSEIDTDGLLPATMAVRVELFGSLAATAIGHGTIDAVLVGLEGHRPDHIHPGTLQTRVSAIRSEQNLKLGGRTDVKFDPDRHIVLEPQTVLDRHPNGLRFTALNRDGNELRQATYFSIGGGFIVGEGEQRDPGLQSPTTSEIPFPFHTAAELLRHCAETGLPISAVMLANESVSRTETEVRQQILSLREAMESCVRSALGRTGKLPGGLGVRRRAPSWHQQLSAQDPHRSREFWRQWTNLTALAVNEENASGGRVVTAPTNGAAGVIPAVLHYALNYCRDPQIDQSYRDDWSVIFLLTAGAIGALVKTQASISGAEVGCQGEIGTAAAMAAGALTELRGERHCKSRMQQR